MGEMTWTQFTKKIHISTSMEKLYWCWATKAGITTWFLKDAIYKREGKTLEPSEAIRAGDSYTWKWHNWDGKEEGKILEANGKDFIRFSFAGECEVEVNFEQKEDAVLLSLKQSKIPVDENSKFKIFYGCSNGWTFWLANLKAYLEHSILLNETKIDLRNYDWSEYQFVNM